MICHYALLEATADGDGTIWLEPVTAADLPGGQPARGQRQHDLVDAIQAALPLPHDRRLEAAISITGHLNLDRADLSEHGLGPVTVARVAAVAAGRVVLVIPEMRAHLLLNRALEHRLRQPGQQPTLTDELHPVSASLRHELFRQLLLINLSRHGLDRLDHCWSFPAKQRSACRGQLHRIPDSPTRQLLG
jgi:hypothetical protein